MTNASMALPADHLERLFGRDLTRNGWQVELPTAANDDDWIDIVDPSFLLSILKRNKR